MAADRMTVRVLRNAGLALLLAFCGPTWAGPQADRALAAVADLIARGEVEPGATLKLAFKHGNINALLGADLELQREWEERTGTRISARVMPNQPTLANFEQFPEFDLTVGRPHEYQELLEKRLIEPLDSLSARFALGLDDDLDTGYIRPRLQAYYGDRLVAVPADGDVALLYLRKDLLEDAAERKAFRQRYGREMAVPKTWDEYDDLVAFFHRPAQGLYGAAEERDPDGGWMYWMQRYLSQADPYQPLFDDQARPMIESRAGIEATEHYVNSARHAPPRVTDKGNDYSYVLPIFMQGKAFSSMTTIAGAKLFSAEASAVRGRFLTVPIPGHRIDTRIVRRNVPIYGNNLVVSSASKQKPLAFLFAMWLTDPDVSLRTVGVRGGHTDPYRWHHLKDARIEALYTRQALDAFAGEWAVSMPLGTGLSGESEYIAVLDHHLWLAARGEVSAAEAMARTAREWNRLTERIGPERQIAGVRAFRAELIRREPLPGAAGK